MNVYFGLIFYIAPKIKTSQKITNLWVKTLESRLVIPENVIKKSLLHRNEFQLNGKNHK